MLTVLRSERTLGRRRLGTLDAWKNGYIMFGKLFRTLMNEARILRSLVLKKAYTRRGKASAAAREFHRIYFDLCSETWCNTNWLGVPVQKCPLDLWIYQEIMHEVRPDLIIETGTADGGSALYLAHVCDALGTGQVLTVDIKESPLSKKHERIEYLVGSSVSGDIISRVRERSAAAKCVMVILDSDHRKPHVLAELGLYSPLVSSGSYMIVEDTNLNGHPVHPGHGPGPMEAVDEFLANHADLERDPSREKFMMTFNPKGYLRKA
jgi:cephalosporin hydroxylase